VGGDSNLVIVPFLLNYASSNHAGERSFFFPGGDLPPFKNSENGNIKRRWELGNAQGGRWNPSILPFEQIFFFFFKD
jgi:hypothetical protein